jgi:transcription-repair coupling factor (superfamily II helicase)
VIETSLCTLERRSNTVENLDDVTRVHAGLVDRLGKKRARERSLMRLSPLRELCELHCVLVVECDVHGGTAAAHRVTVVS